MRGTILVLACLLANFASQSDEGRNSLAEAAEHAVQQSKLTLPGSKPFRLKAEIVETTNPKSDYRASIEEYWISPSKYRRTIESPDFSQTLVVNADAVYEKNVGDYFPFWLNELVTAMFDPLPMLDAVKQVNMQLPAARRGTGFQTCADLRSRPEGMLVCFEGGHGLLASVISAGYSAQFWDFRDFGGKLVARRISDDPEPGTHLEARITELTELTLPDESLFELPQPTPAGARIRSLKVAGEDLKKSVVGSTDINWTAVGEGPTSGRCSVYVSADKDGHIREAWPAGCDNAGLQDPLREAVTKWTLRPMVSDGGRVQVESTIGFSFHTSIDNAKAPPLLSDAEARKLATRIVEPVFSPGSASPGMEFVVQISVDETGKLTGVGNQSNLSTPIFMKIYAAVMKWQFRPYEKDGKPQYIHANLIFHMQ